MRKRLPTTVIALGFVSLLTDLSSEMIYPLLPVFLSSVLGAGALALGIIEGVAEMTASVLKIVSGYLTDRSGRRKPLVTAGYSLSSLMRPLIGLARVWPMVLFLRFMDRVGKGLRTSPRDALIADVTDKGFMGRAYGYHRAMDHAGAVMGPLVAVALLKGFGLPLREVFLLSALPGFLVILVLFLCVKEGKDKRNRTDQPAEEGKDTRKAAFNKDFRLFLAALFVFTLGNSTDAFILLRFSKAGLGVSAIAILWSAFHVVKILANYAGGRLTDRVGGKSIILAGWIYYALIYCLFALVQEPSALIAVFLAYGGYFGLAEPAERAWVSSMAPKQSRGRAFGYYNGTIGIASLPASLLFGLIWQSLGYGAAFLTGGALALAACVMMARA